MTFMNNVKIIQNSDGLTTVWSKNMFKLVQTQLC